MELNKIYNTDCLTGLKQFPDNSIDCVVTSPPYYALRDYGVEGQLGLEKTFHEYIEKLLTIFDEVKRVLKPSGTCWVNLGDSYSGSGNGTGDKNLTGNRKEIFEHKKQKPGKQIQDKCLLQIPSRFSIGMTDRGWILRNEIIWYKRNCMPSSVRDRFTVDFEKIYFFTKSKKYYFEQIKEPITETTISRTKYEHHKTGVGAKVESGNYSLDKNFKYSDYSQGRNKRCVWDITTKPYREAHFATYPEDLVKPMIQAGCPKNGIVLDIFAGSGTTLKVAKDLNRNYIGIELNPEYIPLIEKRLELDKLKLAI